MELNNEIEYHHLNSMLNANRVIEAVVHNEIAALRNLIQSKKNLLDEISVKNSDYTKRISELTEQKDSQENNDLQSM